MNNKGTLQEALISSFVWKGEKRKEGDKYVQDSKRFIDMTPEELIKCYRHCEKMLYNNDPRHLGRYNVLEDVKEQIYKCNIELFLRYCENTYLHDVNRNVLKRDSLWSSYRTLKEKYPQVEDWDTFTIDKATSGIPDEFKDIKINDAMDGCIDFLGAFDKSHLTMTFITKMGIWFTKSEENEMKGVAQSNIEKLKYVKDRLHLPEGLILRFNEKGLSFHEMRAMLTLPKKQKYSDMTTEQLITLRNKILLRFQKEVDNHIFSWQRLKKQIEAVAKEKNITLQ